MPELLVNLYGTLLGDLCFISCICHWSIGVLAEATIAGKVYRDLEKKLNTLIKLAHFHL